MNKYLDKIFLLLSFPIPVVTRSSHDVVCSIVIEIQKYVIVLIQFNLDIIYPSKQDTCYPTSLTRV